MNTTNKKQATPPVQHAPSRPTHGTWSAAFPHITDRAIRPGVVVFVGPCSVGKTQVLLKS